MSFNNFSSSVKLGNIKSYSVKNTNDTFKNSFYTNTENIDYTVYEDIDYNAINLEEGIEKAQQLSDWDAFWADAGATVATFAFSVVEGFINVGEGLIDGTIYSVAKTLQVFGVDDKWAEDIIAYDVSGELYDWAVDATGIDKEIAYGPAHAAGNFVGEMAGYYALSCVPYAGPALTAFAGAGKSVEESINTQLAETGEVDDWKVFGSSALGALEGYGFGKAASGLKAGFNAISKGGLKTTAKETLKAFNKTAIKSTIKNSGKTIAKNAALSTLYDSDTWVETASVLADDVVSGFETGEWNFTSMICEAATVYGENYVGNLAGGILSDSVKKIDRITELYEQGQDMARGDYNVGFKSYREHAEKHVYYVAEYMQDISKNVEGINTDEALFAALSHDLGMKGGYVKYNGRYVQADDLLSILKSEGKDVSFKDIANYVRKPHPLNSALTILTDDIVPDGVDKDVVALLAMSHSKSTSGITYFDNKEQWKKCVDELGDALEQYNIDHQTLFTVDTDKLKAMIDNPDDFARLQKEALIIRDGDAMSKVATLNGDTIMQTGDVSHIENKTPRTSFDQPVAEEKIELAGLTDDLKTPDGKYIFDGDVSDGVKYHVGELNTQFSSQTDGMSYYSASVDLVEPNQTPNSTFFAITERIGEANTYSNCGTREFTINLPKEAKGTALGDWYESAKDDYIDLLYNGDGKDGRPLGIEVQKARGLIDDATYKKQSEFYKNIKVEFIEV